MTEFNPGDRITAKAWPRPGARGTVLKVADFMVTVLMDGETEPRGYQRRELAR